MRTTTSTAGSAPSSAGAASRPARRSWTQSGNAVNGPEIRLAAEGAELRAEATPIDDPAGVAEVVEKFGEKYGAARVQEYYPKQDAALEVPLA